MNNEIRTKLLQELTKQHPTIKGYLLERCVTNYLEAIIDPLLGGLASATGLNKEFEIATNQIRHKAGRISLDGDSVYIYTLMQAHPTTRLIDITFVGFSVNGKVALSKAKLNSNYKGLIMKDLINPKLVMDNKYLTQCQTDANWFIPVDSQTLTNYANVTETQAANSNSSSKYGEKLYRNLKTAQYLLSIVNEPDENNPTQYLKELWYESDTGRIYGKGYSLQVVAKEVRHAALGFCHKYDFKACVFAIMAGVAHEINPTLKIAAIADYVHNRSAIRKRIANEVGVSEELIKSIFTSISFGAELTTNPYKSIRKALSAEAGSQIDIRLPADEFKLLGLEQYNRLINNDEFMYIYQSFQLLNDTILQHEMFSTPEFELYGIEYKPTYEKNGKTKKRNREQKLAWIYQRLESHAIVQFADVVTKRSRQEALLLVHDGVYYKKPIPKETIKDAMSMLKEDFPHLCYLEVEHEPILPIGSKQQYEERFDYRHNQDLMLHNEVMAQQEHLAKSYQPKSEFVQIQTDQYNPLDDSMYEAKRKIALIQDLGIEMYNELYAKQA